jgi:hypothetical protein
VKEVRSEPGFTLLISPMFVPELTLVKVSVHLSAVGCKEQLIATLS